MSSASSLLELSTSTRKDAPITLKTSDSDAATSAAFGVTSLALQEWFDIVMPEARSRWHEDGYVVLPELVPDDALAGARSELSLVFPTADEFHDDVAPQRNQRFRDEFGGI